AELPGVGAEERREEPDVVAPGQLGVEGAARAEERADGAPHDDAALRRLEDSGERLEQGGLAGPVGSDDGEHLAGRHGQRPVAKGPEGGAAAPKERGEEVAAERPLAGEPQRVLNPEVPYLDRQGPAPGMVVRRRRQWIERAAAVAERFVAAPLGGRRGRPARH